MYIDLDEGLHVNRIEHSMGLRCIEDALLIDIELYGEGIGDAPSLGLGPGERLSPHLMSPGARRETC